MELVVLRDRMYVVGAVHRETYEGEAHLVVRDGAVLRRWGTTAGIGQLVPGPTKQTILDKLPGISRFPAKAVVFRLELQPKPWEAALNVKRGK